MKCFIICQNTFSPAVIQLKPENINFNLLVITLDFSCANDCLHVTPLGMSKQCKRKNAQLLVCK